MAAATSLQQKGKHSLSIFLTKGGWRIGDRGRGRHVDAVVVGSRMTCLDTAPPEVDSVLTRGHAQRPANLRSTSQWQHHGVLCAVLCAGNTMEVATWRAQEAADTLAAWACHNKMVVAGEKTQLLVLSQNARDAVDCAIKVAGKTVKAGDTLVLLAVEIDRRLQFGAHCRRLKRRVRPRIAHLRRLSGRSWGLDEGDLRTVANGYVRGAIEHAAAAWLPAAAPSHAELLEREMRAAARVVTGREEPDRPDHVLRRCPALMGTRLRRTGHINLTLEEVRGTELVAALAAAARAIQGRLATL